MESMNLRRTLVSAAVAAALGVASSPADAAKYGGFFDPIDFFGNFVIDVANDACLSTPGWKTNGVECGVLTLESASATVFSSFPDPVYEGFLTFAPPFLSSPSDFFGINVLGGKIDSIDTRLIHHVTAVDAYGSSAGLDFWLQFTSGNRPDPPCDPYTICDPFVQLSKGVYAFSGPTPDSLAPSGVASYVDPTTGAPCPAGVPGNCINLIPTQVPEPGTLGLILGALGGGGLARRRRKKVVRDG
jgi:hypothetical protein